MNLALIKYGIIAFFIASLAATAYVKGRKDVRVLWDAEKAAYALALAQKIAANKERERQWTEYAKQAEVLYGQKMLVTVTRARDERQRLRDSAATAVRVSQVTGAPAGCPICHRCATRAELLGIGEEVVRLAESADRERAGLEACAKAWPG